MQINQRHRASPGSGGRSRSRRSLGRRTRVAALAACIGMIGTAGAIALTTRASASEPESAAVHQVVSHNSG